MDKLVYKTFKDAYLKMKQGQFLTIYIPGAGNVGKGGAWLWYEGDREPTALYIKQIASDAPLKSRPEIIKIVDKILELFDFTELEPHSVGIVDRDFIPFGNKLKYKPQPRAPKIVWGRPIAMATDDDL